MLKLTLNDSSLKTTKKVNLAGSRYEMEIFLKFFTHFGLHGHQETQQIKALYFGWLVLPFRGDFVTSHQHRAGHPAVSKVIQV